MSDLEQRVKVLETKVKLLEETLETIKNMSLSEQMGDYIHKKSKSIKMIDLINSMDEKATLDFEKERASLENVREAKQTVDAQIAQAIQSAGVFSDDFPDDPRYFNYEIEDGTEIDYMNRKIKNPVLSKFAGKGIRITSYNGFETKRVIVPNEIDGYTVISIGEKVFMKATVSEVVLPKSIKFILANAFEGCKKLKHIDLPESIEYLGHSCFAESGLVDFNCPDSLEIIPYCCFDKCVELKNVNLGRCISKLEFEAFRECFNLKHITLPDCLLEIGSKCFERTPITTMIFPSMVKKISKEIFGDSYTRNANDVVCVFLGKDAQIADFKSYDKFYNVSLVYCLPGSNIQQIAREHSIPIKPLSDFRMDEY